MGQFQAIMRFCVSIGCLALACVCTACRSNALPSPSKDSPWGVATVRIEHVSDAEAKVVVKVELLKQNNFPYLAETAFAIARVPTVLTVNDDINLCLPMEGMFSAIEVDGDKITLRYGHDPSLTRVGQSTWEITVPITEPAALNAIRSGRPVRLDARGVIERAESMRGLVFAWQ